MTECREERKGCLLVTDDGEETEQQVDGRAGEVTTRRGGKKSFHFCGFNSSANQRNQE